MDDDETQKAMDFVQRELQDALQDHVGKPLTEDRKDAVNRTIVDALNRMSNDKALQDKMAAVGSDYIREQLARPSPLKDIFPVLRGPFSTWGEGRVVHVAGHLGEYEVRICDYQLLTPGGYGCPGATISCLECLTSPHATSL